VKVLNPRSGVADHDIAPLGAPQVAALAGQLRAAQPGWAALGVQGRSQALLALADAIGRHRPALAAALEADTGRRRVTALEIDSVLGLIRRWAAGSPGIIAAAETAGPSAMPGVSWRTTLEPYALVGVISPWNFPLLLALTDAVPALAAGAAALVKPSEVTPRFIRPLMAAVADVPALAPVLALVEGDGATGASLIGAVDFIAFTGSVATGRRVAAAAAEAMIPASLELGGKDPLIVTASADPAAAARIALSASCRGTGQACQSIERVYVAAPLMETFLAELVAMAAAIRPNAPDIAKGELGPFIFARQADIVEAQLADAVGKGATILTGGTIETIGGGRWLMPTVVTGVSHDMALMREETFGPVIPVMPFADETEAVRLANDSEFGLSAAVVAGSLAEAAAIAERLAAGAVSLNDGALTALVADAPKTSFGRSGLGPSRAGPDGLLRYLRRRVLYAQEGTPLPLAAFAEG
jgi:acyl-CoA reductase-like NAD-dependent aldehyde dehydrogenase